MVKGKEWAGEECGLIEEGEKGLVGCFGSGIKERVGGEWCGRCKTVARRCERGQRRVLWRKFAAHRCRDEIPQPTQLIVLSTGKKKEGRRGLRKKNFFFQENKKKKRKGGNNGAEVNRSLQRGVEA